MLVLPIQRLVAVVSDVRSYWCLGRGMQNLALVCVAAGKGFRFRDATRRAMRVTTRALYDFEGAATGSINKEAALFEGILYQSSKKEPQIVLVTV